jgi:AcrR family transcriptional regulator
MARWEPNAIGRLQEAALELFRERGYEQTTVAEIAERAGLTRRTFFRYFTDKREVLFHGTEKLEAFVAQQVLAAPDATSVIDAVAQGLEAVAEASDQRPGFDGFARQRQALIRTCPELQERELIKLASLGSAVADALRRRGVAEPAASLSAEAGVAAFKVAFERWVGDARRRSLRLHLGEAIHELLAVTRGQIVVGKEASSRSHAGEGRPATRRLKGR